MKFSLCSIPDGSAQFRFKKDQQEKFCDPENRKEIGQSILAMARKFKEQAEKTPPGMQGVNLTAMLLPDAMQQLEAKIERGDLVEDLLLSFFVSSINVRTEKIAREAELEEAAETIQAMKNKIASMENPEPQPISKTEINSVSDMLNPHKDDSK